MTATDSQLIEKELAKLKKSLGRLSENAAKANLKLEAATQAIKKKEAQLQRMSKRKIFVSEHAVIRFLERFVGIDMDQIRDQILPESEISHLQMSGDGEYRIANDLQGVGFHTVRVKGGTIVTVV